MEKVNGCPKDIGLKNIFKNILLKKKKKLIFYGFFYIPMNVMLKLFLNSLLTIGIRTLVNTRSPIGIYYQMTKMPL